MKIVITVDIPDEAKVTMGGLASDEPPLPEAPSDIPLREVASGECPIHHVAWKTVPAGVSKKTGKPFEAFRTCPEYGCNERPR